MVKMLPDRTLLSLCGPGRRGARREHWPTSPCSRRSRTARRMAAPDRRDRRRGCGPRVARVRAGRGKGGFSAGRQRAAPFRMERMQLAPVRLCAQSAHRAPLPRGPRHAQLAHPRRGHQAGPAQSPPREGHRGGRGHAQDGLRSAAHGALRSRRHLHERTRQSRGRWTRRHLHARSRDLRGEGRVGKGPRPATAVVRLLVAPRAGHDDHQRVGHAEHGEGRREPGAAARAASTATRCTSGTSSAASTSRRSSSARSSRWCSSSGRRTTRASAYGFVGVVISLANLSSSVFMWYRDTATGEWAAKKVIEIPGGAGEPGRSAGAAQGVQGGAAAGDRHQPLARRSLPVRVLLGHGRAAAVRRDRSVHPEADRQREDRRHRQARRRIRRIRASRSTAVRRWWR